MSCYITTGVHIIILKNLVIGSSHHDWHVLMNEWIITKDTMWEARQMNCFSLLLGWGWKRVYRIVSPQASGVRGTLRCCKTLQTHTIRSRNRLPHLGWLIQFCKHFSIFFFSWDWVRSRGIIELTVVNVKVNVTLQKWQILLSHFHYQQSWLSSACTL